jgi:hypothetical protein
VHCKKEKYDVYIGRPSKWGNPFTHLKYLPRDLTKVKTRAEAVAAYAEWILHQPELIVALPELRGKTLGCWCAPSACHGDVLLKMANAQYIKL